MALPNKSVTYLDYLGEEEGVDYDSDTQLPMEEEVTSSTSVRSEESRLTPNPLPERESAHALTALRNTPSVGSPIITNPLDEQQRQQVHQMESAQHQSAILAQLRHRQDYVFTPLDVEERIRQTVGQSLVTWVIGPEASSPEEIASRKALRERYLEPAVTTPSLYKGRLVKQGRGESVPPMKGVPILLFPGETPEEEDNAFIRWVHLARRLSSMMALRASANVADVRLERKLRYDYAKLKAKGQLRTTFRSRYASATSVASDPSQVEASDPSIPTLTGGKRLEPQGSDGYDVQKRQRRMGNLVEGVSRTPVSSRTQGTLATSPDTGIGHCDDVVAEASPHGTEGPLAHREAPVAVGVSAEAHAEVVQELKCVRETVVQNQSKLEEQNARLSRDLDIDHRRLRELEHDMTRLEAQLDMLIRMSHPVAKPPISAQAPSSQQGTDPDTA